MCYLIAYRHCFNREFLLLQKARVCLIVDLAYLLLFPLRHERHSNVYFDVSFNGIVFTRESSYSFQRVLAIAILFVCPSVCLSHGWISHKRCKLGAPNQDFSF